MRCIGKINQCSYVWRFAWRLKLQYGQFCRLEENAHISFHLIYACARTHMWDSICVSTVRRKKSRSSISGFSFQGKRYLGRIGRLELGILRSITIHPIVFQSLRYSRKRSIHTLLISPLLLAHAEIVFSPLPSVFFSFFNPLRAENLSFPLWHFGTLGPRENLSERRGSRPVARTLRAALQLNHLATLRTLYR